MDVTIVIPNYQGRALLPKTLGHLRKVLDECRVETEVIVVDDASKDDSVDYVRTEHPWVRLVAHEKNLGFSGATNTGADASKASLIYFMNSDVFPHPGFLEPLVDCFQNSPEVFSAVSVELDPNGRVIPPGQVAPRMERGHIRVHGTNLNSLWNSGRLRDYGPVPTFFGAGGSVMVHRQRFLDLGGFADAYRPFYYEDIELGWRAWRRGWTTVLEPNSVVVHDHVSGSIQSNYQKRHIRTHKKRNRFLLVWRNYINPRKFFFHHILRLPLHLAGRAFLLDRHTLHGFLQALRELPGVRKERRDQRQVARLSDESIFEQLREARRKLLDLDHDGGPRTPEA